MNRTAAERAVHGYIARFGTGTTAGELFRAGRFYLLVGDLTTARQLTDRANQAGPGDLGLIFAALLADAAGDTKSRDAAISAFAKLPDDKNTVRAIGRALEDWMATGKIPDAATVDSAVSKLPPEFRTDGDFCFGWYLHNRKLEDRAVVLWKRCLESDDGTTWVKTHARAFLTPAKQKKD